LLEGFPAVILGILTLAWMTDRPRHARWLAPQERAFLEERLADEARAKEGAGASTVWQAMRLRNVWLLALGIFATNTGGYALGFNRRARSAAQKEEDDALLTLMRVGWGKENPAFRQLFTSQFMPGATKEQADWYNELQRITVSGEMAARMVEANGDTDVTALLSRVTVPTLVMHAREDARVPFEAGRRMAAGIPGARFVPLQGRNHLFLESEPAFAQFLEQTRAFLVG
jgi:pimeloyl-ACP methyl ester carboxylesterase